MSSSRRTLIIVAILSSVLFLGMFSRSSTNPQTAVSVSVIDSSTPQKSSSAETNNNKETRRNPDHDEADDQNTDHGQQRLQTQQQLSPLSVSHNKDAPLCILPVGDSLTQGVEIYTGYRSHLKKMLLNNNNNNNQKGLIKAHFVGSKSGTCVLGNPGDIFDPLNPPSSQKSLVKRDKKYESKVLEEIRTNAHDEQDFFKKELHEGHCSWGARLLKERLDQLLLVDGSSKADTAGVGGKNETSDHHDLLIRGPPPSSVTASFYQNHPCRNRNHDGDHDELLFKYDIALLMIGHNNVFQTASTCKLREGRRLNDQAWNFLLDQRNKVMKGKSSSSDTEEYSKNYEKLLETLSKKERCAAIGLKTEFVPHLVRMIEKLLGEEQNQHHQRLIIGLNPPTGFPNIDALLHQFIRMTVRWKIRQDGNHQQRISFASFPEFGKTVSNSNKMMTTKHTFDSTHPNEAGAKILAQGWKEAIERLL